MFKRILAMILFITVLWTFFIMPGSGNEDSDTSFLANTEKLNGNFSEANVIVKMKAQNESSVSSFSLTAPETFDNSFLGIEVTSVEKLGQADSRNEMTEPVSEAPLLLLKLKNTGYDEVQKAVEMLNSNPIVEYAEPDYIMKIEDTMPNDTDFSKLYGMNQISAPAAWDKVTGSKTVKVGIIDSGIDITHEDLKDNIWKNPGEIPGNGIDDDENGFIDDVNGWNFVDNTNNVMDDNKHGTHVSGIIGATGNNRSGVCGVTWKIQMVALKALNQDGIGYTSNFIKALNYAKNEGIMITNNSYGGGSYSRSFRDAIQDSGALFVAAAGNDALDSDIIPHYPSGYDLDNIISVGACDDNNQIARFSNYGKSSVDLVAPGVDIYSCLPGNNYGLLSGTSMAAPHVAGAAALLLSNDSTLPVSELVARLRYNGDIFTQFAGKTKSEARLNAFRILSPVTYIWVSQVLTSQDKLTMRPREIKKLTDITVLPQNANNKDVIFTSSNTSIATVNPNGEINSLKDGTVKITISSVVNPNAKAILYLTVVGSSDEVVIPDMNFKAKVIDYLKQMVMPGSNTENPYLNYTVNNNLYADDVYHVTELEISDQNIENLTGIAYFTNLLSLNCSDNYLTSLDVSQISTLKELDCSSNRLTFLDFKTSNKWTYIYCQYNYLDVSDSSILKTKLGLTKADLRYLPQLTKVSATGICLDCDNTILNIHDTMVIKPTFLPQNATDRDLIWTSSNPSSAEVVQNGIVVAKGEGTAEIKATLQHDNTVFASKLITVTKNFEQPISFQDQNFKAEILNALKTLDSSYTDSSPIYKDDLLKITSFTTDNSDITSFEEIQYCYQLTDIKLYNSKARNLNLTPLFNLKTIELSNGAFNHVDVNGLKNLKSIYINNTNLSFLNVDDCSMLKSLDVSQNNLYVLNLENLTRLTSLNCSYNNINYLDVSNLSDLENLNCSNNKIIQLNVNMLIYLTQIDCQENQLTLLNINPNGPIKILYCQQNYLDLSDGSSLKTNLDLLKNRIAGDYITSPQKAAPPNNQFLISPHYLFLENGSMGALSISQPSRNIIYSSSDENVATVNQYGIINPKQSGHAIIRAAVQEEPALFDEAEITVKYSDSDGDGTSNNPFKLRNKEDLFWMSHVTTLSDQNQTADIPRFLSSSYILEPENGEFIDLLNEPFEPIGFGYYNSDQYGFRGSFDGNQKEIRNLKIDQKIPYSMVPVSLAPEAVGLLSCMNGGSVKDLQITGADVNVSSEQTKSSGFGVLAGNCQDAEISNVNVQGKLSGDDNVSALGGLVGVSNHSALSDCSSDVEIKGLNGIGGLIGNIEQQSNVSNCFAVGNIKASDTLGGFAANCSAGSTIDSCYSVGNVWGKDNIGGFIGEIKPDTGNISKCYASGSVSGNNKIGGFCGVCSSSNIHQNLAAGGVLGSQNVGGFVGYTTLPESDLAMDYRYENQKIASPTNSSGAVASLESIESPTWMRDLLGSQFEIDPLNFKYYPKLYHFNTGNILSNQYNVTIGNPLIKSIKISSGNVSLPSGNTYDLTVSLFPESPISADFYWASSNPDIVSVNENGEIVTKSIGEAQITVQLKDDPGISDQIVVNVTDEIHKLHVEGSIMQEEEFKTILSKNTKTVVQLHCYNSDTNEQNMQVFAVIYDEQGRFKSFVDLGKETLQNGEVLNYEQEIPIEYLDEPGELWLFTWKELEGLNPITNVKRYKIE